MDHFIKFRNFQNFLSLLILSFLIGQNENATIRHKSDQLIEVLVADIACINLKRVLGDHEEWIVKVESRWLAVDISTAVSINEPIQKFGHLLIIAGIHTWFTHLSAKQKITYHLSKQ